MANRVRIDWRGPAVLDKARRGAVTGLSEVGLRTEGAAKAELYPGHGKRTGTLQRAIQSDTAEVVSPTRVRVVVAVRGVPYARRINRLYRYMQQGWQKVAGNAGRTVSDAIKEAIGG